MKEILSRRPKIDLHEIRRAHIAFRSMSLDHLGLRVDQVAHAMADHAWK